MNSRWWQLVCVSNTDSVQLTCSSPHWLWQASDVMVVVGSTLAVFDRHTEASVTVKWSLTTPLHLLCPLSTLQQLTVYGHSRLAQIARLHPLQRSSSVDGLPVCEHSAVHLFLLLGTLGTRLCLLPLACYAPHLRLPLLSAAGRLVCRVELQHLLCELRVVLVLCLPVGVDGGVCADDAWMRVSGLDLVCGGVDDEGAARLAGCGEQCALFDPVADTYGRIARRLGSSKTKRGRTDGSES